MKIKSDNIKLTKNRINRVGYTLHDLEDLYYEISKVLGDYELESYEAEIYVFRASDNSYYYNKVKVTNNDTELDFYKNFLCKIKKLKTYKRDATWCNKLYDYAKLNNYVKTFVSVCDNFEFFNERKYQ